jgi:tetratricopeptide (TPR) repeat protein
VAGGAPAAPPVPAPDAMRLVITTSILAFALAAALLLGAGQGRQGPSAPTAAASSASLPPPSASTAERLTALRALVRAQPGRPEGWTLLAGAELQHVREIGDASSYVRAQADVARALRLRPGDQGALAQRAALALSRHDFRAGLRDAETAHAIDPAVLVPYGALVDANVELGRYGDAARVLQHMVDRKPDLASLTRVSYLRELHGDLPGALQALTAAQSAGGQGAESTAFATALQAGLQLQQGRIAAARRSAREALHRFPGYPAAEAGLAKAEAAAGHLRAATRRLRALVDRLPLPDHVTLLAETELAAGDHAAARRELALVEAERRLQRAGGVIVDTEAALFEADHGDPRRAVALARRAWAAAPSIRSADALGWALTRADRPRAGLAWARRALRLGWREPSARLHAGVAAARTGHRRLARAWLTDAVRGAGALGPWQARAARRALAGVTR